MESPDPSLPIFPLNSPASVPPSEVADELQPWFILTGENSDASVTLWRLEQNEEPCVALFSNEESAAGYAESFCQPEFMIKQFDRPAMLRIFVEAFKSGIEHAALDPQASTTRRIFRLRDVLKAAKSQLR